MSGGVDSSVAALLLKNQGYDVTGIFMKNWSDPLSDYCTWKDDQSDMRNVCKIIGIPYYTWNFEKQYRNHVLKYLVNGYKKGITPNPDILCNREIKFKAFLIKSKKMGARKIATGHYVINKKIKRRYQLWRAIDGNKDQSYFLALLNQSQLKYSLFPIGIYTKKKVRQIAKKNKLPIYDKKDSQGVCFIGKVKFSEFLKKQIKINKGPIVNTKGECIGKHDGLAFYTIGQRHGLKIGGGIPYYVVSKKKKINTLIVGTGNKDLSLFKKSLLASKFSWISNIKPKFPLHCQARIRYRQPLQGCIVRTKGQDNLITFNKLQRAVTPGQFVVLYKRKQMIGGGIIKS